MSKKMILSILLVCFVLMQSKEKSTRYYLAVHLQESFENLSFDIDVTPGTVVGHIGPYPNGAHLHVSVIELSNGEAYENNRIPKDGSGAVYAPESNSNTYRFPTFDYKNRAKMKNPFNYEEPWVGRKKN